MKLSAVETMSFADEGSTIQLRDKFGKPWLHADGHPQTITVYGQDGTTFERAKMAKINARMKTRRTKITAEELKEESIDILVLATKSWDIVDDDGVPIPFTKENVRQLYVQFPRVKEQVDQWMAEEANFGPASSTIS